jgi:chemotaxis protein methyltransferase CheR
MKPDDFAFIADLLRRRLGLVLPPEKRYLAESRLTPVMRKHGFSDLHGLTGALRRGMEAVIQDVSDAMTTNETLFFRDVWPFETFRTFVLPAMLERRAANRGLRILCCAAASGQEPYSLSMILAEERMRLRGWRCEIVATDVSRFALAKARSGLYSDYEVRRGLPPAMLSRYFKRDGDQWQVNAEIAATIQFVEHNLLTPLSRLGRFDVVFCRNVLIYFDVATKGLVLAHIRQVIADDGYLFLGSSETVMGITDGFTTAPGQSGLYGCAPPRAARAWSSGSAAASALAAAIVSSGR